MGAIGGPAGLWAAWNQHQANKRRRNGPPAELVSVLAKVIEIADTVTYRYRDESWLDGSGLQSAKERLSELNHLVVDQWLSAMITVVGAEIGLVLGSVTSPSDSPEQRASTVAKQTRDAVELKSHAQRALSLLRPLL
ncbi:hypothetical protein ACH444_19675 [Streptomyces microflavus]|uniref:hypothetical protein n=1 Tax=Streptomyces microflavus TaxID=1919 RepID=UPI003792525C